MRIDPFFLTHPIFTIEELDHFLQTTGEWNPRLRNSLLSYHVAQGQLLPVRRGIYATIPAGRQPSNYPVDPFLLASRLTSDAVLSHHTALALHGIAHSIREDFTVLSQQQLTRPLHFRGATFRAVPPRKPLLENEALRLGVQSVDRMGLDVRVTTLERTLVDALDRPVLAGGWEEIWRSLEEIEYLDIDLVVRYTLLLQNATTSAKVGYFLEKHRVAWMVQDIHLEPLRKHRPRQPHYVERPSTGDARSSQPGKPRLIPEWNILIPTDLQMLSWEENSLDDDRTTL